MSHIVLSALDNAHTAQTRRVVNKADWIKDVQFGVGVLVAVGGAAVLFSNLLVLLT